MLHYDTYAQGGKPKLLIIHGLFGSARNWGVLAKRLSERFDVTVVDQRNHGHSPWFDSHNYHDMAADLHELAEKLGGDWHVLGHSMGGKAAMVFALMHPQNIRSLVVADIAPVSYAHSQMQYIEAMQSVDLTRVAKRSDAAAQLAAQGVEAALQSFFTQSLDLKEKKWRLNLSVLAKDMREILGFPSVQAQNRLPCLFIRGAQSDYILPQHRGVIRQLFPNAHLITLKNAGHWLHADQPRAFQEAAEGFIDMV